MRNRQTTTHTRHPTMPHAPRIQDSFHKPKEKEEQQTEISNEKITEDQSAKRKINQEEDHVRASCRVGRTSSISIFHLQRQVGLVPCYNLLPSLPSPSYSRPPRFPFVLLRLPPLPPFPWSDFLPLLLFPPLSQFPWAPPTADARRCLCTVNIISYNTFSSMPNTADARRCLCTVNKYTTHQGCAAWCDVNMHYIVLYLQQYTWHDTCRTI